MRWHPQPVFRDGRLNGWMVAAIRETRLEVPKLLGRHGRLICLRRGSHCLPARHLEPAGDTLGLACLQQSDEDRC